MNIGFYNPYHRTLGGGELYLFLMMQYFLPHHKVIYFSDQKDIISRAEQQFGISLRGVEVSDLSLSSIQRLFETRAFDMLFWYSDGSLPLSFAKKTYVIFQFPVPWVTTSSLLSRVKLHSVTSIIVNSQFTKKYIDQSFHKNARVLYPAIPVQDYSPKKKTHTIVSVGRFTTGMNMKRQDILIESFKQLVDKGIKGWTLVLAGGLIETDRSYVEELKKTIQKYPIEIKPNVSRHELLDLYATSSLYWHAAGYETETTNHPELAEHFGISILEAMASGTVPLVYDYAGPSEIVIDSVGIRWKTIDELVKSTKELISNEHKRNLLSEAAQIRASTFDTKIFLENFHTILSHD